jgi:type II secretory ATPase GspE/PulE/Tfp pilus assembly ATPase PilB-like protein
MLSQHLRSTNPCESCKENKNLIVLFPFASSFEYLKMTQNGYKGTSCSTCGWLGVERRNNVISRKFGNRVIHFLYGLLGRKNG